MFSKKNKLQLSSTELKENTFVFSIFNAIMLILVLWSIANIEYKLNTFATILKGNCQAIN